MKSRRSQGRSGLVAAVGDAATSSIGNLVLSWSAARLMPLAQFGQLSVCMTGAIVCAGLIRVFTIDPLVLGFSAVDSSVRRSAARAAISAASLSSIVCGVIGAAIALVGSSESDWAVATVTLVAIVALALQECTRWVSYCFDRPFVAFGNTLIWTIGTFVGVSIVVALQGFSTVAALLVWSLSAVGGAGFGLARLHVLPSGGGAAIAWIRQSRVVGSLTSIDYGLTQLLNFGAVMLISAVLGVAAYGAIRLAQLVLAPVQMLVTAGIAFLQPRLVRLASDGDAFEGRRLAFRSAIVLAISAVAIWVILVAVPDRLVAFALGPGWASAEPLVGLVSLGLVGSAFAATIGPYLRSIGRLRYEVIVKSVAIPITLLGIMVASIFYGVMGAVATQSAGSLLLGLLNILGGFYVYRHIHRLSTPVAGYRQ